MSKKATFFGGAVNITNTKEYLESVKIGEFLSKKGYTVFSGGYRGLMEAVSKGASEAGGLTIGVTCKTFVSAEGNKYLSHTLKEGDIYDRLRSLIHKSDLFIVQRGGLGTLAELFLAWDVYRKIEAKPRIYVIGEMFKHLINSIEQNITPGELSMITFCEDYDDFVDEYNRKGD